MTVTDAFARYAGEISWADTQRDIWKSGARARSNMRTEEEREVPELEERTQDALANEEFDYEWSGRTCWAAGWEAVDAIIDEYLEEGEDV